MATERKNKKLKTPLISIRVDRDGFLLASAQGGLEGLAHKLVKIISDCYQLSDLKRFARESNDGECYRLASVTRKSDVAQDFYCQLRSTLGVSLELDRRMSETRPFYN